MSRSRHLFVVAATSALLTSCGGGSTQAPETIVPLVKAEAPPGGAPLRAPPLRAAASTELDAEIDALLDWAQNRFPDLFSGAAGSQTFEKYRYRHYPATGNYVGVAYGDIYVQGPAFAAHPQFVGTLHRYQCQAFPQSCNVPVLNVGEGRDAGCSQYQEQRTSSAVVTNNVWNPGPAGTFPYEQCLRVRDAAAGGLMNGWRWKWPASGTPGTVFSNPALVYGLKPWVAGSTTDPRLPARVGGLAEFKLSFDLEVGSNGVHNTVATLWLTRNHRTSTEPNSKEISTVVTVWAHDKGMSPAGTQVGVVSAGGLDFDVYYAPVIGDPAVQTWKYVAYRLRSGKEDVAVTLDLRALLADAVQRGFVSASEYVASAEIGNEIQSGSGYTWIRSHGLQLTSN